MPIPDPNPSETKDDFMARCMSDETMKQEYPSETQRAAVCYRQYQENTNASD